ncbi:MAG: transcriptional regulator [Synechococcales cyanobacterium M58_A2018_015]|nr:transcriptional regulator [Synechococcales cyanobacterium M58_A2018_015]
MSITEAQILEIIRQLPQPALDEVKVFLDFLTWRYQENLPQPRGAAIVTAMRGKATAKMTTDEILDLTRGHE